MLLVHEALSYKCMHLLLPSCVLLLQLLLRQLRLLRVYFFDMRTACSQVFGLWPYFCWRIAAVLLATLAHHSRQHSRFHQRFSLC